MGVVSPTRVVIFAAALSLAGYVYIYATGVAGAPIRSDGFGYYVYLPSWFLFHDSTLASAARDCCGGEFPGYAGIMRWPGTRRWVNVHPIGVAIMQAPAFLAAHGLTRWSNLSPDGFTLYYQHAAGLSGVAWMLGGLWVLARLLRRHFSDSVCAAALCAVLLGTNLYHYGTYDGSYSHAYSFFLFAALLSVTEQWYLEPTVHRSLLLGAVCGLIVLTRHTNVLVLIVFPLYGLASRAGVREPLQFLARHWRLLALLSAVTLAIVAPQLALYHQATGHVIVSPYTHLGFHWTSPRIGAVLFSVQKGLFFWSPVLLLALPGLWWLLRSAKTARAIALPGLGFLAVHTYVIASWGEWQLGGSYGSRGFVETMPLFALGLAETIERTSGRRGWRAVLAAAIVLLTSLSIFQMLQYWHGIIPTVDTTWEQYKAVFLKWR